MEQPEWIISDTLIQYDEAVAKMEERVADIRAGNAPELVWLLEHPSLYTAGTSAKAADLLDARFPVHETGRGGQFTYHGPGQRIAYVMLDLKKRQAAPDIKRYVCNLEQWIINSLQEFDIKGQRVDGRVGIWVDNAKIAALGVRVRHWVTYHGISINVNPDLSHFSGIVPCGINDAGVTSFEGLGKTIDMSALDSALQLNFEPVFQSAASGKACALT